MTQEQLKAIQEKWAWWMTFPQRSGDPAWAEAKRDIDALLAWSKPGPSKDRPLTMSAIEAAVEHAERKGYERAREQAAQLCESWDRYTLADCVREMAAL